MASVERPSLCPWLPADSPRFSTADIHAHKTQSNTPSFHTATDFSHLLWSLHPSPSWTADTCRNHKPSHGCNSAQPPHFCSKTLRPGSSVVTSLPTLSQCCLKETPAWTWVVRGADHPCKTVNVCFVTWPPHTGSVSLNPPRLMRFHSFLEIQQDSSEWATPSVIIISFKRWDKM